MPDYTQLDVIIIGGGINGAGIARDAAMRGLRVLLVDKGDVGSGTSSWSTRLIHGGLRYLEHFEFGLVRESLRERETLLRIAPHLVKPLLITIPIYKRNKRGPWTIRAGMVAYDLLSLGKSLPRHRMLSINETLNHVPGLNPEGLLGSAQYHDAQVTFAERLVLENVLAARERGAQVITYATVKRFFTEGDAVSGVEFVSEDGTAHVARAAVVINAAGPWVDRLLERAPVESPNLIAGTKGSHLVVPKFPGAPESATYLEAESDRRPFFIIPWNRKYLIGTTDVRFEDDPDKVRCEPWEVDYLLTETNRAFPQARLTRRAIFYTYSGVRPLPRTNQSAENITRRHFIREHPQLKNLFSIVGGKLTTYRSLSEECVNLIFRKLDRNSPRCTTATDLLPGMAAAFNLGPTLRSFAEKNRQFRPMLRRLRRIYGFRAGLILKLALENKHLSEPLGRNSDVLAAEVVFAFEEELAKTLADCFLRRTMLGLKAHLGLRDIDAAAQIGKRFLGWSDARAQREIDNYRAEVKNSFLHNGERSSKAD
jgi:glycerol-3-phosphate dehydrogenase